MTNFIEYLRDRLTIALIVSGAAWFTLGTAYDFQSYGHIASMAVGVMLLAIFGLNALAIVIKLFQRKEEQ